MRDAPRFVVSVFLGAALGFGALSAVGLAVERATPSDMPLRRSLCVQIAESGQLLDALTTDAPTVWTGDNLPEQTDALAASSWTTDDLSRLSVRLAYGPKAQMGEHGSPWHIVEMLRRGAFDEAHAVFRASFK